MPKDLDRSDAADVLHQSDRPGGCKTQRGSVAVELQSGGSEPSPMDQGRLKVSSGTGLTRSVDIEPLWPSVGASADGG
eukprot:4876257-Alexandrium_andersonii.AAC.1